MSGSLTGNSVYISSSILNLLGEEHLLAAIEGKIAGLNPKNGKTLWEKPWKIFLNNAQITQPIALTRNSILLAAGYGKGAECWTFTRGTDGRYQIDTTWKSKNLKAKFSNPVLKDGYLYGLSENLLVCIEAKTGKLKWRGKKYVTGVLFRRQIGYSQTPAFFHLKSVRQFTRIFPQQHRNVSTGMDVC